VVLIDAKTGKQMARCKLPGAGENYYASPIASGEFLYFAGTAGTVSVVRPGPEFEVVATNRLDGGCYATPALGGDRLYVRTTTTLYCFGKRK
jgi:hypothetical protein